MMRRIANNRNSLRSLLRRAYSLRERFYKSLFYLDLDLQSEPDPAARGVLLAERLSHVNAIEALNRRIPRMQHLIESCLGRHGRPGDARRDATRTDGRRSGRE